MAEPIEDGTYEFEGRRYQLPLNEPAQRTRSTGSSAGRRGPSPSTSPTASCWSTRCILSPATRSPLPSGSSTRSRTRAFASRRRPPTPAPPCPYGAGAHPYLTVGTEKVDSIILCGPAERCCSRTNAGSRSARSPSRAPNTTSGGRGRSARRNSTMPSPTSSATRTASLASSSATRSRNGLALWVDEGFRYLMLFTGDPLPDVARRSLAVEPMTCPPTRSVPARP